MYKRMYIWVRDFPLGTYRLAVSHSVICTFSKRSSSICFRQRVLKPRMQERIHFVSGWSPELKITCWQRNILIRHRTMRINSGKTLWETLIIKLFTAYRRTLGTSCGCTSKEINFPQCPMTWCPTLWAVSYSCSCPITKLQRYHRPLFLGSGEVKLRCFSTQIMSHRLMVYSKTLSLVALSRCHWWIIPSMQHHLHLPCDLFQVHRLHSIWIYMAMTSRAYPTMCLLVLCTRREIL